MLAFFLFDQYVWSEWQNMQQEVNGYSNSKQNLSVACTRIIPASVQRPFYCFQELQGVLKHLERQLRAVERAAIAGHLDTFLIAVSEAVASHNTVAEHCEKLAQLPVSGLPQLLRQHADSAVSRATADQVHQCFVAAHRGIELKFQYTAGVPDWR